MSIGRGSLRSRPDLYQIVTFATGFRSVGGLVVGFTLDQAAPTPPTLRIGETLVAYFVWPALPNLDPREAGARLILHLTEWLEGLRLDLGVPRGHTRTSDRASANR